MKEKKGRDDSGGEGNGRGEEPDGGKGGVKGPDGAAGPAVPAGPEKPSDDTIDDGEALGMCFNSLAVQIISS